VQTPDTLPGEAKPGTYRIIDGHRTEIKETHGVFPIIRLDEEGHYYLLGTGFFISTNGLFVTARHVLTAPFENGKERFAIGLIHFTPEEYFIRPILRFAPHANSDVAVGVAAPMIHNVNGSSLRNQVFTLDSEIPSCNTRVATYAYPKYTNEILDGTQHINFVPSFYDGDLIEYYPNGRDKMLPGRCFHTSMRIHSGASGGPVFSSNGHVFGINSTGYDGTDISFVSSISDIFDLSIDNIQFDNNAPRSATVRELAKIGYVLVKPPLS
jgi:hypothetical protein